MSKYTPEACARAGIPYCQQKEREWYMRIADAYDEGCYLAEPATARFSRSYTRMAQKDGGVEGWQKHPSELATIAEWRNHWRSLPDYDGPPMRAPSGPVFELFDCSGTPAQEFSAITNVYLRERISDAQAQAYAELLQHFAAMARRGECEFVGFGLLDMTPKDAYEHPSVGGRGWCPKLAEASK